MLLIIIFDVFEYFLYLYFRSLDVLGTNTETQFYSEERRKSSFSPRRTSGASSVSGTYIKLLFNKIQSTFNNIYLYFFSI